MHQERVNKVLDLMAPNPRPKLEAVDLAIQRIPNRADTFMNTKSHKPIFLMDMILYLLPFQLAYTYLFIYVHSINHLSIVILQHAH